MTFVDKILAWHDEFTCYDGCHKDIWCSDCDKQRDSKLMTIIDDEQDIIKKESFDKGVEEGRSTQAIIEIRARELFLNDLRVKQSKFVDALEKISRVWEQSDLQGEGELRNDLLMTKHIADAVLKEG